ncbi:response regulator [Longitalea luteola]|uniref:response regulator n=1 Tax=Longitalea luteola TaxID=2812563 RepID=UPI001A958A45|nr:response regulator [Longitalea luteola]
MSVPDLIEAKVILHIDDDQDDRFLVRSAIKEIDPAIIVKDAHNGRNAIEFLNQAKFEGHLPSLIILDYNMPLMNGLETYKEIRKDPELPSIPVVLLTTFFNEKDSAYWENENVTAYTKPSDYDAFTACVKEILDCCDLVNRS